MCARQWLVNMVNVTERTDGAPQTSNADGLPQEVSHRASAKLFTKLTVLSPYRDFRQCLSDFSRSAVGRHSLF